jgi:hypothetical protein
VEKAFVKDIKKVSGKTTLLFRLAEAAVDKPDGTIREVVFPVVSEQTLRDLVKEYELCVLHTLREKVRSKEVWVQHAGRFRDPHEDLPKDFARKRTTYYDALHLPTSPDAFIQRLQAEMTTALEQLNQNILDNPYVRLLSKSGGWISLSPLPPQSQPQHLRLLKGELGTRWPMIELLDILKETDLRVRFTDRFHTLTLREHLDRATIQKRLLLGLYGLGTNIGLKRVCAGDQSESYRDVLYVCRRFLTKDALRAAIADVANAIFRVRRPDIWGEGTTACESDSKKYVAWDQNLMTEWHPRYRGPGFQLLPRLKNLHAQKLYRPETGHPDDYPNLQPILTRPIKWELIRQQYDEMVKFATALRLGTAETEEILRRFTRNGVQHPTYATLLELGKVQRTIFLCHYLSSEELRREIQEGQSAHRELECGDQFYSLRSPWGVQYEQHRRSRASHARPPSLADIPHLYSDFDDSRCFVRAGLDEPDDQRGSARADPADLQQCQSLWPHSTRHGRASED